MIFLEPDVIETRSEIRVGYMPGKGFEPVTLCWSLTVILNRLVLTVRLKRHRTADGKWI